MNIGIDARLVTYRRGMGNLVYNLLIELAKLPMAHHFYLYVDQPQAIDYLPQDPRFTPRVILPGFYPLWEQILLPRQAQRDQLDILHCPANTAPIWMPKDIGLVITIHDVMYLLPKTIIPTSPSLYQRLGRSYRRWVVPYAAQRAALVLSDSAYSRTDTLRFLHLEAKRVQVVYGAQSPAFRKIDDIDCLKAIKVKFGIKGPMVVALGAIDPRKNTGRVIEAFAQFKREVNDPYQLVLVGLDQRSQALFSEQATRLGINTSVIFLDFIAEDELILLYNSAKMVLYPSLYEGLGLPVLEAMACGAPVISSNTTSIPEVAGEAAILVDPLDTQMLVSAMVRFAQDETFRQKMITRGLLQSAKFSWRHVAEETIAHYERIGKS